MNPACSLMDGVRNGFHLKQWSQKIQFTTRRERDLCSSQMTLSFPPIPDQDANWRNPREGGIVDKNPTLCLHQVKSQGHGSVVGGILGRWGLWYWILTGSLPQKGSLSRADDGRWGGLCRPGGVWIRCHLDLLQVPLAGLMEENDRFWKKKKSHPNKCTSNTFPLLIMGPSFWFDLPAFMFHLGSDASSPSPLSCWVT